MPYVADGRELIRRAFEGRYAIPAFNICSLEMARACVEAAEQERAPVILQTSPGDLEQASPAVMAGMVRALAEEATVPVMLHLDHGDGLPCVVRCLRAGYASTMFDAADRSPDENVRRTRRAATVAHAAGAALEAAAGSFGSGEGGGDDLLLTEPEVAERLFSEAQADMVACSVGSRHGQPSRLDLARLEAIAERVRGPLVLHGGSGIPAEDLARAALLGVVKVNIGTVLLRTLLRTWRQEAGAAEWHYDVYRLTREALTAVAREKLEMMNTSGQA